MKIPHPRVAWNLPGVLFMGAGVILGVAAGTLIMLGTFCLEQARAAAK